MASKKLSASKDHEQTIKELQSAVAEADALAAEKANFLAMMSHEMRTPMQTVYGFLELIEQEQNSANIHEMVKTAKGSVDNLLDILDDILDFAKMDADKLHLEELEVPVRTLVGGVVEALSVKVRNKNVQLKEDVADKVPSVIISDPKRLRQVLINLVGNALKFTENGSVTIKVTKDTKVIPLEDKQIGIRIEVIDTGIGLSNDVIGRLFQPFSQADNTTARKFGGTGLGLSICKKLVDLMGGMIGVTSKEGKGSTFWFEFPTCQVTEHTAKPLPDLSGISILSVEDHPQGAREIALSLDSMGAQVESVDSVREALKLVHRRPFDVAVVDQGLPDGLGIDLIREILQIRPYIGQIMYTVRDDYGLQHACQSLGIKYLGKPASRLVLGETVQDVSRTMATHITTSRRVLIAEDNASVRDVMSRQLKNININVDFVENGQKAFEKFKTGQYGLIITDLHMPESDGYDLVDKIRAHEEKKSDNNTHFPVIVMTADVQMSERRVYLEHGFNECLLKPVSMAQMRGLFYRWGIIDDETRTSAMRPPPEVSETYAKITDGVIDLDKLAEQIGGSHEEAIQIMHSFVEMTAPILQEIQLSWDAQDFQGLREAAHSLKGGARSACCTPLADAADNLQEAAIQGQVNMPHISKIWRCFTEVEQAVRSL
jgi:two-component system, sensor histidine kinase and response regulator